MIFPRYSIRWLLAIVVAAALFFLCFSLAMRGHTWASAIVAPGLGLLLLFALFLISYSILYCIGSLVESVIGPNRATENPFAPIAAAQAAPTPAEAEIPAEILPAEVLEAEAVEADSPPDAESGEATR